MLDNKFVLLIGDIDSPGRSLGIPEKFMASLTGGKVHQVLCTGNIGAKENINLLKRIAPIISIVRGPKDEVI